MSFVEQAGPVRVPQYAREPMIGSVGVGGQNNPSDVSLVRQMLNDLCHIVDLPGPAMEGIMLTGTPVDDLVEPIKEFQNKYCNFLQPDGLIEPNLRTYNIMLSMISNKEIIDATQTFLSFSKLWFFDPNEIINSDLDAKQICLDPRVDAERIYNYIIAWVQDNKEEKYSQSDNHIVIGPKKTSEPPKIVAPPPITDSVNSPSSSTVEAKTEKPNYITNLSGHINSLFEIEPKRNQTIGFESKTNVVDISIPLAQRNPKWGKIHIGYSTRQTISAIGCALTRCPSNNFVSKLT